jgi:DNA mismatch endonuclease, patch repair protein
MSKIYVRDNRSPKPKNENTSRVMSANKAKNTSPEIALRKFLYSNGHRSYRIHPKDVVGKPDIVFRKQKVAIFVHGCYWHRCPHCSLPLPKYNTAFWREKFEKNYIRDEKRKNQLIQQGWKVFVAWECIIKKNISYFGEPIKALLNE